MVITERRDGYHRANRHIMAETAKPPGLGQLPTALPSSPMRVPSFRDGIRWASKLKTPAKDFPARPANHIRRIRQAVARNVTALQTSELSTRDSRTAQFYVVGAAVGEKVKISHDLFAIYYRHRFECAVNHRIRTPVISITDVGWLVG